MIPEAVYREVPQKPSGNGPFLAGARRKMPGIRPKKPDDRIRVLVLAGSCRFRAEPEKSTHWIRSRESCFHFPLIVGAFLSDPARIFRPGLPLT